MRFYWICDRISQKQFNVYWQKEDLQKGDYHPKHQPNSHFRTVIPIYLFVTKRKHSSHLQGCVNSYLGTLDVHAIKKGAQGAHRKITKYIRGVYSRCKVKTTGHPIFNKYIRYDNNNNGDLCKTPKHNRFNKNSLSQKWRFIQD